MAERRHASEDGPRWRHIERTLLDEIMVGALQEGDRLPSENMLAPRFGVTRATVRRALSELRNKGIVRSEQGRGVFVARRLVYGIGPASSFRGNLMAASLTPDAEILARARIAADTTLAARLGLGAGAPVLVFETLSRVEGAALSFTRHHLPEALFPDALARVTGFGCITDVYRLYGFADSRRAACEIAARLPTSEEARLLEQPREEPILELCSIKRSGLTVIDLTLARFCSSRVSFFVGEEEGGRG